MNVNCRVEANLMLFVRLFCSVPRTIQLQDHNNNVIAFYRPTRVVRYNIGDVYGELHFCRNAGAGVVVRLLMNAHGYERSQLTFLSSFSFSVLDAPSPHGHGYGYRHAVPICYNVWPMRKDHTQVQPWSLRKHVWGKKM